MTSQQHRSVTESTDSTHHPIVARLRDKARRRFGWPAPSGFRLVPIVGLAGLLSGLLGTGGASLLIPAFTEIAGLSQHRANGLALAATTLVTGGSAFIYASRGQIDAPLAVGLAVISACSAVIGAQIGVRLPAATLRGLFAGCLLLIAVRMLGGANLNVGVSLGEEVPVAYLAAGIGAVAGLLSGLVGVGGGAVLTPGLVWLLGMDQVVAQGVSLAVITPTALAGAVTHYRLGHLDLQLLGRLAPAGVVGGVAGALAAAQFDPQLLRIAFALFLFQAGVRLARRR